jgi:hypothetical protein
MRSKSSVRQPSGVIAVGGALLVAQGCGQILGVADYRVGAPSSKSDGGGGAIGFRV